MATKSNKSESYRELRDQLDEILIAVRSGELDIDEASKQYEKAKQIVEKLEKYLTSAENTVTKIKNKSD